MAIKQGTLSANSIADTGTSALGFGPALLLGDTTGNTAGTFQYTGANATTGRTLSIAGQGGTIDTGTNNVTFTGAATGSGTLSKAGSGTLTLSSASNNYSGSVAVLNGTLSTVGVGTGTAGTTLAIGSAGNSATYQYTGASASENRAIATAGTSATINVPSAATSLTLSGNISGATALTVSGAGTLNVGGNNSQSGLKISAGTVVNANVTGSNTILGSGAVTLSGGTLNVVGSNVNPVGLSASLFLPNAGSPNLAATMLTFLANSSAAMPKTLNQDLTFTDNPASTFFNAPIIANTAGNNFNFSDLYTGFFTPTVTGVHTFSLTVDDNADFWIDLNRNGVFDAGEDVVTKHGSGTLSNTTSLTAGLSYKIAITHEDTAGTSIMTAQFSEPAGGTITSLTNINPSTQGTRWTTGVGTVGFSTTDVVLTTDSVLNVSSAASFRTLIPTAGQTLNLTSGAVRFAGTDLSTTNPLKVNVSSGASLALGALGDAGGASVVTITQTGLGQVTLDDTTLTGTLASGSAYNLNSAGTLFATSTTAATALRGMNINLNSSGAVLNLAAVSAGSAAFQNAITVNDNAAINVLASQAVTLGGTINLATAGKTLTLGGAANNTVFNTIISGPGALTIASPATVTLTAADTYTGGTTVSPGATLLVGSDGLNPGDAGPLGTVPNAPAVSLTLAGGTFRASGSYTLNANRNINLTAGSTIDSGTNNVTIAGVLTGSSTLTKTGSGGTLTLTGNSPAFTGQVIDSTGTLTLAAGASFNSALLTANAVVNINGSWTATAVTQGAATVTVSGSGASLTTGTLTIAKDIASGTMNVSSGATLAVTGNADLNLGASTSTTSVAGILNMTGASSFTATVAKFNIGTATNTGTAAGTLNLATNNTITANTFVLIADQTNGAGVASALTLGTGTTTFATPSFTLGGKKSAATFQLQSTTGGTLNITGTSGNRAALLIGENTILTSGTPVDVLDMTMVGNVTGAAPATGVFTGNLTSLVIGEKTLGSTGSATGSLILGSNSANILNILATTGNAILLGHTDAPAAVSVVTSTSGTLTLGAGTHTIVDQDSSSPAVVIGSFTNGATANTSPGTYQSDGFMTLSGGTLTLKSANAAAVLLANRPSTTTIATDTSSGTLSLNGGVFTIDPSLGGGNIIGGGGNSTVNLAGATLDMGGKSIGTAANPITNFNVTAGTLQNLLEFNNGGLITKSGPGTLTLAGTNKYTGGTAITAGTVVMNAANVLAGSNITSGPMGSGPVTLSGGTLSADSSARTLVNTLSITGNSALGSSGSGALTIDSSTTSGSSVTLSNTPTVNFGSNVTINSKVTGTSGLGLSGLGSLTLANSNNDFSGNVTTATKLTLLNNSPVAGSITVNAGGSLNGNGIISGGGTVNSNGVLTPHVGATANTLTIRNGLALADSSVANFLLGASSDSISGGNSGILTLAAGAETMNLSGTIATGQYHLFTGFNSVNMGSSFGSFHIGTTGVPNDVNVYTFALAADTHGIDLNVIAPNIWTGAADHAASNTTGTWNTTTANWSGASSLFAAHDIPRFDDAQQHFGDHRHQCRLLGREPRWHHRRQQHLELHHRLYGSQRQRRHQRHRRYHQIRQQHPHPGWPKYVLRHQHRSRPAPSPSTAIPPLEPAASCWAIRPAPAPQARPCCNTTQLATSAPIATSPSSPRAARRAAAARSISTATTPPSAARSSAAAR